jgi:hypothetical protein
MLPSRTPGGPRAHVGKLPPFIQAIANRRLAEVVGELVNAPLRLLALENEDRLVMGDVDGEPLEPGTFEIDGRVGGSESFGVQLDSLVQIEDHEHLLHRALLRCAVDWLTEPSTRLAKPPRPRLPTTSSVAPTDCSASTSDALPSSRALSWSRQSWDRDVGPCSVGAPFAPRVEGQDGQLLALVFGGSHGAVMVERDQRGMLAQHVCRAT